MSFNLDLGSNRNVELTRSEVLRMLQIELREELSDLMDQLCKDGEVIRIDRLELNLGALKYENLKLILKEELYNGLHNAIAGARNSDSSNDESIVKTRSDSDILEADKTGLSSIYKQTNNQRLNTLIYFFENGVLPWWNAFDNKADLIKFVQDGIASDNPDVTIEKRFFYRSVLKSYLIKNKNGRLRFINVYNPQVIEKLLRIWFPNENEAYAVAHKWLVNLFETQLFYWEERSQKKLITSFFDLLVLKSKNQISVIKPGTIITEFTQLFFFANGQQMQNRMQWVKKLKLFRNKKVEFQRLINQNKNTSEWIDKLISELDGEGVLMTTDKTVNKDKQELDKFKKDILENTKNSVEGIEFDFAGIVILWPMFTTLFKNRELTKNNTFISDETQLKALQILNYMACGEDDLDEFQMPLNKLICGIPIQTVVEFETALSNEDKEEINELLKHVIENWSALKSTSPEGLRSAFLNRKGELNEQSESWTLKVDESGVDILLRKLPWGYQTIKLPWMTKLIQVEW